MVLFGGKIEEVVIDLHPVAQHLSNAFELNPEYKNYVAQESDFDGIRNDPDFLALTTVIV